jgi:hypothetical protein
MSEKEKKEKLQIIKKEEEKLESDPKQNVEHLRKSMDNETEKGGTRGG